MSWSRSTRPARRRPSPGVWGPIPDPMLDEFGRQGSLATADPALAAARGATAATGRLRNQLDPFQSGYSTPGGVTYPPNNSFARRLGGLAAMLDADLPLKAVALEAPGGYDTHSDQASSLPNNLKLSCDSLLAFQRDLEARGLADRVLVNVWSEFGRRPGENGSGTDHGAAGASFVIGSRARGQMVGEFPGLTTLDSQDNLRHTSDFRALYCSLLEQWFELAAAAARLRCGASPHRSPVAWRCLSAGRRRRVLRRRAPGEPPASHR